MTQLYLIRHGETEWSLSGQHTGRTDLPLIPQGRQGAARLAERLRGVEFSQVLTSPRLRARQTCELVGLAGRAVVDEELCEWDYGDYEGQRTADIVKTRPGWNLFLDGAPKGESPAAVGARADHLIQRLRGAGGNVALFTHGHFGRVLAVRWIHLPVTEGQRLVLHTASLSILGCEHHHIAEPVISLWNAV